MFKLLGDWGAGSPGHEDMCCTSVASLVVSHLRSLGGSSRSEVYLVVELLGHLVNESLLVRL